MTGRVAVIGDVGGHLSELRRELVKLGAHRRSLELPDDLTVVQLGDLIHRGPDSDGVVTLVDRYLGTQHGQWVQLTGNHEAQYLREPAFDWPERIAAESVERLRAWWATGDMRAAVAVQGGGAQWLVTHAGLTEGFWRRALGSPISAANAAVRINSFIGTHEDVLFSTGQMLGGGDANLSAGPIWASAGGELIPSWLQSGAALPFHQIHGHSAVIDRRTGVLVGPPQVVEVMTVDAERAHETASIGSVRIVGVDPGHGRKPHRPWASLILDDARVIPVG